MLPPWSHQGGQESHDKHNGDMSIPYPSMTAGTQLLHGPWSPESRVALEEV